jgi:molybdopterin molybdotransferase
MDFLEALRILATKGKTVAPAAFSPEEAPNGYLAEAVEIPALPPKPGAPSGRRAARNGYALPAGIKAGDEAAVAGTVPAEGHPPAGASPAGAEREGRRIWRVETGAYLPGSADRVLKVSGAIIVGTDRIRILELPPEGSGVLDPRAGQGPARVVFDEGTRVDGRLRSLLAASGVPALAVRPGFSVGLATVGDELIDLASPSHEGQGRDVTAPWMEEAIARLELVPVPLGILPDSVDRIRDAILRARDRRIAVLLLLGGIGDGTTDRTLEALVGFGATLTLEGLNLDGGAGLLFAKVEGLDIFAVGGRPLEASMVFDVLARPALLARLGAARAHWDWSRLRWDLAPGSPNPYLGLKDPAWVARPGALRPSPKGPLEVRAWEAESFYLPLSGGQEGWALFPPASSSSSTGSASVYYQPIPGP